MPKPVPAQPVSGAVVSVADWGTLVRNILLQSAPAKFSAANQLLLSANALGDTKTVNVGTDGQVLTVVQRRSRMGRNPARWHHAHATGKRHLRPRGHGERAPHAACGPHVEGAR